MKSRLCFHSRCPTPERCALNCLLRQISLVAGLIVRASEHLSRLPLQVLLSQRVVLAFTHAARTCTGNLRATHTLILGFKNKSARNKPPVSHPGPHCWKSSQEGLVLPRPTECSSCTEVHQSPREGSGGPKLPSPHGMGGGTSTHQPPHHTTATTELVWRSLTHTEDTKTYSHHRQPRTPLTPQPTFFATHKRGPHVKVLCVEAGKWDGVKERLGQAFAMGVLTVNDSNMSWLHWERSD